MSSSDPVVDQVRDPQGSGQRAALNGIDLYFEVHGTGRPLVLLHGGLMSGESFGPVLPALADHHQVILVDLQGHGRTADIDRPIDVHPEKIRRAVVASANVRRDAIYPEMLEQQAQVSGAAAEFMKDTPMYELYQRVAPRPEDFPRLLDKIGASMADDFDFSDEVRGLRVPTLVMAADADMAPPSHYVEVFRLLDGGLRDGGWLGEGRPAGGHALAILPGLTHYDIAVSPLFAATTLAFLDA